MELGQRLKQARLEAGLSQRQLCGDAITRNMLSLIENGSAHPSMDTLRILAARLGKPMGYFLEDQAVTSPNQEIMTQARAQFAQKLPVTQILENYQSPDAVFDWEYHLLMALSFLEQAKTALAENRAEYAWNLLEQAQAHSKQTPYYTQETEATRLVLCYRARPQMAGQLAKQLPPMDEQVQLLAQAEADPVLRGKLLDAFPGQNPQWHLMRAETWFAQGNYAKALIHYENAPQTNPVFRQMEICCRELEDYKSAYYYAKKQG